VESRSGGSPDCVPIDALRTVDGANAEEAQDAQTKPDYAAKMSVARKEARETRYWLHLAIEIKAVAEHEIAWELKEVVELRAMIVQAIKTAQSNGSRGQP
jgi:four helix bundle protein